MARKMLMAKNCSLAADGVAVYLDDYDTREEAEKALYEAVMENADYAIEEVEE